MSMALALIRPQLLRRVLWLLAVAAVVACALLGLRLAKEPAVPEGLAVLPDASVVNSTPLATLPPVSGDYLQIAAASAFGSAGSDRGGTSEQRGINAVVVGTIVHGPQSLAIVELASGSQKLLRTGDMLDGGRVKRITREGIVLDVGGQEVALPLAKSRRSSAGSQAGTAEAPAAGIAVARPSEGPAPVLEYEEDATDIDLANLDDFAKEFKTGLGDVPGKTAHDVLGQPVGLALEKVPEGGLLARLGLQSKDIITNVNDVPVSNMGELIATFEKAADEARAGETSFIVFDLIRNQKSDTVILTIW